MSLALLPRKSLLAHDLATLCNCSGRARRVTFLAILQSFLQYAGLSGVSNLAMTRSVEPESDRERVSRWVRQHGRVVRGYLLANVGREDVADDILQEVFRKAWQAREQYQEQGYEKAYLLRIADRLVVDWSRRSGLLQNVDEETWEVITPASPDVGAMAELELDEHRQHLSAALDRLTPPQKRVLMLRYFGELEFSEIARTLDCPLGTVLSHCRRGLLQLRRILVEPSP